MSVYDPNGPDGFAQTPPWEHVDDAVSELAIGNAVQVGLMALDGYWAPQIVCGVLWAPGYMPPDWRVDEYSDRSEREFYRYRVRGLNHSARDTRDERFSWSVPSLCWRFYWEGK